MENPTPNAASTTPDDRRTDTVAPADDVTAPEEATAQPIGSDFDSDSAADGEGSWLPPLAPGAPDPTVIAEAASVPGMDGATDATDDDPPPALYDADVYDPVPLSTPESGRRAASPGLWRLVVAGAIGAALMAGVLFLTGALDTSGDDTATRTSEREIITISGEGTSPVAVGAKVTPSIVTVETGFDRAGEFAAFGSGSGVVLTGDGLIATNHHVIEDASSARVVFQDGRIYEARLVGSDPITDLAVLRIEAIGLVPVELGATSSLSIGDAAIAIGNPLGQQGGASLTVGVVSAFNREVGVGGGDRLFGMIQTDAPITQGSSGGALVDNSGRLIGITTAIGVSSAGAEGIGYAIPVELVTRITDEIIATGGVRHPFLGVRLEDSFEEGDGVLTPNGAIITGFVEGATAALEAGIEAGDIIIGFEDDEVRTLDDLVNGLRLYRVGDVVSISVIRDGVPVAVDVTLGERPEDL